METTHLASGALKAGQQNPMVTAQTITLSFLELASLGFKAFFVILLLLFIMVPLHRYHLRPATVGAGVLPTNTASGTISNKFDAGLATPTIRQ